ncbi:MAG TPA: TetR/AcrR family transcriptional regulator [Bacillota bacterium]|nr:TetR/AcrR family transcriptional regulator [Bacillota bacterium]
MGDSDKKERVLKTALTLFAEKGYEKTTVEEIALKSEIAKGTVYLYYPSKDAINNEVIRSASEVRRKYIQSTGAGLEEDIRRTLAKLIMSELRFARAEKRLYRLLMSNERNDEGAFSENNRSLRRGFLVELTDLIQQGMARGVIREGNPTLLGQLLNGMVRGSYQMLEENSSITVDQVVLSILDLVWRGWTP